MKKSVFLFLIIVFLTSCVSDDFPTSGERAITDQLILQAKHCPKNPIDLTRQDKEFYGGCVGKKTYNNGTIFEGYFYLGEPAAKGKFTYPNGDIYEGEIRNGRPHGLGIFQIKGNTYIGELKKGQFHGRGIYIKNNNNKTTLEGIWAYNMYMSAEKVDLPFVNNSALLASRESIVATELKREQKRQDKPISIQVTHTNPDEDGSITINVRADADTASLLINDEEQGGSTKGVYVVKKIARAGQETKFTLIATDINGNKDTKVISVIRTVIEPVFKYAQLNPTLVRKQTGRDAVAVIIGIANYKNLDKADFSNNDARAFYDYAIRGLGIKPENIKLLVDENAEEAEILKTFRTWLPSRTKSTTDVYFFYSGHGYPTPDGKGLYLIPLRADREVIDETSIPFSKINDLINLSKPRSVTVILDACYSGQTKAGKTLVANTKPVFLKPQTSVFPVNFTVISASQSDQISSSSPDLQHGIFSYYLMKGMEGDADTNNDGKITLGEMREYLIENVRRQAARMNRTQEPQLIGDENFIFLRR
jgi:hypothetical protein